MAKINITFPVKNAGNIKATNVIGTVTDPVDVSFVKASTQKGTYNSTSKEWFIASLLAGESAELHLEYNIDDPEQFPFTFNITFTSDQSPDADPSNDQKTIVVEREDVFPCPDCPEPYVDINSTVWTQISVPIDITSKCQGCELEVEVVPMSEVNVDSVKFDLEKMEAYIIVEDKELPWSFDMEASCINCPYWCGENNEYGPFGVKTVSGGSVYLRIEALTEEDIQTGDVVELPVDAGGIFQVFRNGLLLKSSEYSYNTTTKEIIFNDPFSVGAGNYGEDVVVYYKKY